MLPTARRVGASGVVYMIDIYWETMRRLRDEAVRVGMMSLIGTTGRDENIVFCIACTNVVFGIDLHDFQDPSKVLRNAQRMLKLGGSVVNLDWKKAPMALDLQLRIWFSEDDVTRFIAELGFTVETVKMIGRYYCMTTFKRLWGLNPKGVQVMRGVSLSQSIGNFVPSLRNPSRDGRNEGIRGEKALRVTSSRGRAVGP